MGTLEPGKYKNSWCIVNGTTRIYVDRRSEKGVNIKHYNTRARIAMDSIFVFNEDIDPLIGALLRVKDISDGEQ